MARTRSQAIGSRARSTVDQNGLPEEYDPQIEGEVAGVTTGKTVTLGAGGAFTPTEPAPEPPPEG